MEGDAEDVVGLWFFLHFMHVIEDKVEV